MALVFKSIQTFITLILTYTAYTLLENQVIRTSSLDERSGRMYTDLSNQILVDPPQSTLLDIKDFEYLLQPTNEPCADKDILFLIIIHSHPTHFHQRRSIRSTWGSLKQVKEKNHKWNIETVFLLGQMANGSDPYVTNRTKEESTTFGDIVQGSFTDDYHNLTYKHLMGLKWSSVHCSSAQYILKADDDAFIDVPGLYLYLVRALGDFQPHYSRMFMAGNVFPDETEPKREGKWAVSWDDYPWKIYPSYLGGLAYIITPDLAGALHRVAHHEHIRPLWIDDVFITGILAATLDVHPFYMNMRYAYEETEIADWLRRAKHNAPPPYTFVHLNTSKPYWSFMVNKLWGHVRNAYNTSKDLLDVQHSILS